MKSPTNVAWLVVALTSITMTMGIAACSSSSGGGVHGAGGNGGTGSGGTAGAGGTGATSASCGKLEPCGGNIVANWTVASTCVNSMSLMTSLAPSFADSCPTFTLGAVNLTASGSLAFNADLTYSLSLMRAGSLDINVPASCLSGGTCADLTAALGQSTDPTVQSITCTGSSSCVCREVLAPNADTSSGTYTTSGTMAMLLATGGSTDGGDYCVQGKELHLITVDRTMNMGPMGQFTINEDIVATKP